MCELPEPDSCAAERPQHKGQNDNHHITNKLEAACGLQGAVLCWGPDKLASPVSPPHLARHLVPLSAHLQRGGWDALGRLGPCYSVYSGLWKSAALSTSQGKEESARERDTFVPRVVKPQRMETGVESILYTSFLLEHHTLFLCSPPSRRDIDSMEMPWAREPHLYAHSGSERCPSYSGLKITVWGRGSYGEFAASFAVETRSR